MTLKRAQGRPIRGTDDVGREKLLAGARAVFRSKLSSNVSWKDIAHTAGVTPALVSYYFPDKASLVLAAAQPVIETYVDAVVTIIEGDTPYMDRLEKLVGLFLRFAAEESGLLDTYFAYARDLDRNPVAALIPDVWDRLSAFLAAGAAAHVWRDVEPGFLLFALWGICKTVADSPAMPLPMFDDGGSDGAQRRRQADTIMMLLRDGIRPKQSQETVPSSSKYSGTDPELLRHVTI